MYEEIDKAFKDKKAIGVRIYEEQRTIQNANLPEEFIGERPILTRWFMQSSIIPSANAIPTCYEGEGYFGMAFGEHVKYLSESAFNKGLVLDIKAAEILQSKGVDVGIKSKSLVENGAIEYFTEYKTAVPLFCQTKIYDIKLDEKAKVLSVFRNNGQETPSSYIYENENGQRFMVLPHLQRNIDKEKRLLKKNQVFILFGQSQAVGHGIPMEEKDKIKEPLKNVFGLHRRNNQSFDIQKLTWEGYTSNGMNLAEEQDDTYSLANCLAKRDRQRQ